MPKQESYFLQRANGIVVEVLKTYDRAYAKEVFEGMSSDALKFLATSLEIGKNYAPWDVPEPDAADYQDFLWDATCETAREDESLYSFFVVNETMAGTIDDLYVAPDWPSAERFAKGRLAGLPTAP